MFQARSRQHLHECPSLALLNTFRDNTNDIEAAIRKLDVVDALASVIDLRHALDAAINAEVRHG